MQEKMPIPQVHTSKESRSLKDSIRSLGKAVILSSGLMAGAASAQEAPNTQNDSHRMEVAAKEASMQHVRALERILDSRTAGDRVTAFEHEVDSIITSKTQFSPEQVSHMFDDLITPGLQETYLAGDADTSKLAESKRAKSSVQKLIEFLYAEKSPFAELPGKTYYTLQKGADLSLPTTEARKIFNFVLNEKYKLENVFNDQIDLDTTGTVQYADVQLMKSKENQTVIVQFIAEPLSDGLQQISTFLVTVKDSDGKRHSFVCDRHKEKDKSLNTDNATYTEIQKAFSGAFK